MSLHFQNLEDRWIQKILFVNLLDVVLLVEERNMICFMLSDNNSNNSNSKVSKIVLILFVWCNNNIENIYFW